MASGTIVDTASPKLTFDELKTALRQVGAERYHHQHPFHVLMHEGKLTRGQLQAWALNRYYYQSIIPIKDSIILSRSTDPAFRRAWRKRILDHDGDETRNGGILRWIKLAEATGLDRDRVIRAEGILPATRFIGNEYLNLVRTRPFVGCVASSLTELFSRDLIALRMEKLRQHYPWLSNGLDYFEARLTEAPEDAAFAIQYVFDHAPTRGEQEGVIQALRDKCDILWAQLDALYFAYVEPGWPSPGAFRIEEGSDRGVRG
ncbi:MAG TPA: pyrroloquinoline-quinone synthase PqqC [Terriglobales bacterium]|nr:pyrroloquinoline-quinone synthase PqqC [Terriglobales bacterium]